MIKGTEIQPSGVNFKKLLYRSFARFGEKGRFLVSGGNDTFIKLWDWALQDKSVAPKSLDTTNNDGPLILNIKHKRKVRPAS